MIVIVLGPPGAGKGTQSQLLAQRLGVPHISTGDLLRNAVAQKTELGKLAQPFMERGELVPDTIMVGLVKEKLGTIANSASAILDGFPRTTEQARALDRVLSELGQKVDRVLYLAVPVDVLVQRLSSRWTCGNCQTPYRFTTMDHPNHCPACGGALIQRPDDREDVVRRRLEVYQQQTAPLIDYYRSYQALSEINGDQSVDSVLDNELTALGKRTTEA